MAGMPRSILDTNTIVAVASPPGAAWAGIVRLSGAAAIRIAARVYTPTACKSLEQSPGWRLSRGTLKLRLSAAAPEGDSACGCPALVYLMRSPRSYTGEDLVEFHLPGSPALLRAAERALMALGARAAEAGEFTLRAFLNGRLDLGQAEAVERLICARSEAERRAALARLSREIPRELRQWREELVRLAAKVEAGLDFEAEELGGDGAAEIGPALESLAARCRRLAARAAPHRPEREGIRVVMAGLTNAGKSSLTNALAGRAAVMVSPETSTTRDLSAVELRLGPFRFIIEDAAGHDPAASALAQQASARARARLRTAALVCLVIDASRAVSPELNEYLKRLQGCRVILALNQSDLPARINPGEAAKVLSVNAGCTPLAVVRTSAVTGAGLEDLRQALMAAAEDTDGDGSRQVSTREAAELEAAAAASERARALLREDAGLELVAEELRAAHAALSRALGEGYAEDVLANIFSRFCVGK